MSNVAVIIGGYRQPTFSNVSFLNTNISSVTEANSANITYSGALVGNIATPVFLNKVSAATTTIRTGASDSTIDGSGGATTTETQSWYYS